MGSGRFERAPEIEDDLAKSNSMRLVWGRLRGTRARCVLFGPKKAPAFST